jgi:hypothetical protein
MPKPRTPTIFTSPQDAAIAFYKAFEGRDVDAMMATWAEDEDIVFELYRRRPAPWSR